MPKIRLFRIHEAYGDYDDTSIIGGGISEWDNVSEEDLAFIKGNLWRLKEKGTQIVLVEQLTEKPEFFVGKIKDAILEAQRREEAKLKKAQEARDNARAKKAAQKAERERQQVLKILAKDKDLLAEVKGI